MKQYIRKPVKVEAIQWTGDNDREVGLFLEKNIKKTHCQTFHVRYDSHNKLNLIELGLPRVVQRGDFLVIEDNCLNALPELEFNAEYKEIETEE